MTCVRWAADAVPCCVATDIERRRGAALLRESELVRTIPTRRFLAADAIRCRPSEVGHPVQNLAAEEGLTPLPSWTPGSKTVAKD